MAGSENGIVIVSAARTPVGSFNGSLASVPASYLGTVALKAAMERAKVEAANLPVGEALQLIEALEAGLTGYTYLHESVE